MEIGIDIKKFKNSLSCENIKKCFFDFVFFKARFFIFILIFIFFGGCIYIWYFKIYSPGWNENRKQEYIRTKEQVVNFNKAGFESLILEFNLRRSQKEKEIEDPLDIFRLKK